MFDRLVRVALRRGLRQGLGDGNRVWMAVGTAAVTVRLLQRLARRSEVVVTEDLAPGQTLVITHLPKPS
jgi:hypothetical protein